VIEAEEPEVTECPIAMLATAAMLPTLQAMIPPLVVVLSRWTSPRCRITFFGSATGQISWHNVKVSLSPCKLGILVSCHIHCIEQEVIEAGQARKALSLEQKRLLPFHDSNMTVSCSP
jgi:hypothetical protein